MQTELENFERLLIFLYVLDNPPKTSEEQLKIFRKISGLGELETQMALDKCVTELLAGKE